MSTTILTNTNAVSYVLENIGCVLLHVCNNKGVMGAGIALEIKNRVPEAYTAYLRGIRENTNSLLLGSYSLSHKEEDSFVCNMVAQNGYGYRGKYLDYGALAKCLCGIEQNVLMQGDKVVIPFNMGCDRAGGDWAIVLEMVEHIFKDFDIIICKLGD